ncbi:MAG TPA: hypothetical protein VIJ68_04615 [Candidatus Saccharimonadales bacterium]
MAETTPDQGGGQLKLGYIPQADLYVVGVTPKLTKDEDRALLDQGVFFHALREGSNWHLIYYKSDAFGSEDAPEVQDAGFAGFIRHTQLARLGKRAVSEDVQYLKVKPKKK